MFITEDGKLSNLHSAQPIWGDSFNFCWICLILSTSPRWRTRARTSSQATPPGGLTFIGGSSCQHGHCLHHQRLVQHACCLPGGRASHHHLLQQQQEQAGQPLQHEDKNHKRHRKNSSTKVGHQHGGNKSWRCLWSVLPQLQRLWQEGVISAQVRENFDKRLNLSLNFPVLPVLWYGLRRPGHTFRTTSRKKESSRFDRSASQEHMSASFWSLKINNNKNNLPSLAESPDPGYLMLFHICKA